MMNYWNRFPLFRMIIPFVFGILLANGLQQDYPGLKWLALVLLIFGIAFTFSKKVVTKYKNRWFYGVVFNLFLILAGYQITILDSERFAHSHILNSIQSESPEAILGEIISPPSIKGKWVQADLEVLGYYEKERLIPAKGRVRVKIEAGENAARLAYGDRIIFSSRLNVVEGPLNPEEFSYKNYLALQSIYHQAFIKEGNWKLLEARGDNSIIAYSSSLRTQLIGIFKKNDMGEKELAVASALILGDKSQLDTDLKSDYSKSGAMHVLAVSGLHVGIIYLVLNWLLGFITRLKNGVVIKATLIILLLWFYALLTGMSPSVMRATTMLSFLVIGKAMNQHTDVYNTLVVSAFLLLAIDPSLILSVGFQLSYLAVFGIVYLYPKFYHSWESSTWIMDKIWALTCVSLAAQLATFPLSLYYFHQFPNWFLLSNLIVIPLATAIIYLGILVFVTSPVQALSLVITKGMILAVGFLNDSVSMVRSLPWSTVEDVSISALETLGLYLVISLLIAFFVFQYTSYLRWSLVTIIFLLLFQVYENQEQLVQRQVIVYNIPRHTAIEFINGKKSVLVADSALLANSRSLDYYTHNYRIAKGINSTEHLTLGKSNSSVGFDSFYFHKNIIQFFDYKLLFVEGDNDMINMNKMAPINCLLLWGRSKIDVKKLRREDAIQYLLIDGSISSWIARNLEEELDKYEIDFINIAKSGAHISVL